MQLALAAFLAFAFVVGLPLPVSATPPDALFPPAAATDSLGLFGSAVDSTLGGNELWDSVVPPLGFGNGTVGGSISGAFVFQDELLILGTFTSADGVPVRNIARWDGSSWRPFPVDPPGSMTGLATFRDTLYSFGSLGEGASPLHRWTGSEWLPVGPPILREPGTRVVATTLYEGDLLVSGYRLSCESTQGCRYDAFLLRWNGNTWTEMPYPPMWSNSQTARSLAVFKGDLYATGAFHFNDTDSTEALARWDGQQWMPTNVVTDGWISGVLTWADTLYLYGQFSTVGGEAISALATWDGTALGTVGGEFLWTPADPWIGSLFRFRDYLIASGRFDRIGNLEIEDLAIWDGATWSSPGPFRIENRTYISQGRFATYRDTLLIAGTIYLDDGYYRGLARWVGDGWVPYPRAEVQLAGRPYAIVPDGDRILVAGPFRHAGSLVSSEGLAAWDGEDWELLATVTGEGIGQVTWFDGKMVVAGHFESVDGVPARNIAHWSEGRWQPLGSGTDDWIATLDIYDGKLLAGGQFREAGGQPASRLAAWDGFKWTEFMGGVTGPRAQVRDMTVYRGELVVGGYFSWAGDIRASNAAAWNGARWNALGTDGTFTTEGGPSPYLRRIERLGDKLIALGAFDTVNGQPAHDLAVWDGGRWTPLEPQLTGSITEIGTFGGFLVAGGGIDFEGDFWPETNILLWNDGQWLRPGRGIWSGSNNHFMSPGLTALATWQRELYAGGYFNAAGNTHAFRLAKWAGYSAIINPTTPLAVRSHPNPAPSQATAQFQLDDPQRVRMRVFDASGGLVATLVDRPMLAGTHEVTWSLRDSRGTRVGGGVYFVQLVAGGRTATAKLVILP